MNDGDLKKLVQSAQPAAESPPFHDVWRTAVARNRRARRRYAVLTGLAATLAIVAIVVGVLPSEDDEAAYIEMAELLETTSWQAPSDVLLPAREFDIYQELPVLMQSTDEAEGALL